MVLSPAESGIYRPVTVEPPYGHSGKLRCDECGRVIRRDYPLVVARIRGDSPRRYVVLTRWFHRVCWYLGAQDRRERREWRWRLPEFIEGSEAPGLYEEERSDG